MSFHRRSDSVVRSSPASSTARRLRAACMATWETLEDRVLLTAVVAPEPATVPTTFPAPGESFFVQGLTSAQNNGQASYQNASAITPVTTNDLILNQLPDALTSGTAAGATATTITLGGNASSTTDAYKGYYIEITGGTGAGQNALITGYDGTTKIATIARGASNAATFTSPWTTIPDATSTYAVRNTNYQGTFEGAGGSIALLTNGTTDNPTNPTPNDNTANTNALFDRDNPWQATYTLGNNPNGYDITEIDSITGHSDPRVNQTIDVQVQYAGSDTNFYSLSAGKDFSYRPDNLNPAPGGSAQLSIIDSSGAGNSIAHNVRAVRYVAVDSGAVVRELSVIGAPSASAPIAPASTPALTGNVTNGADLTLTWTDADTNVSGYKIFKSTDGTNFTPLTMVPGSVNSYTDLAAQPNTSYSYYIVATDNGADSPRSTTLTLTSGTFGAEAHFYNSTFWKGTPVVSEVLTTIDQNHNDGSAPAPGVNTTNYSAIFTGKVRSDAAGQYTFISNSDDDGFLYVNGQLVSSDPGGHGQRDASTLTPVSLAANTQYDFVFLMNQGTGGSGFHLFWKEPVVDSSGNQTGSAAKALVPADHLSPVSDIPPTPQGLTASYYNNQVNLSWFTNNDTSSISYLIERANADANGNPTGNFAPLASVSAEPITNNVPAGTVGGFLNYGDASAVPGQSYVYRITAVNFDGSALDPTPTSLQIPANTQAPGAEAHYFNDEYWKGGGDPRITGTPDTNATVSYSSIDSDWGNSSPDPTIRADQFSTQYTGQILTDQAGVYTFVTNTDDEGFLFLNDGTSNTYRLVSSDPGGHGQRDATNVVGVSLAAHTAYNFVFEQSENGGGAGAHLKWIKPADNTGVAQAGSTADTIVLANSASDQDNSYVGDYVIINSGTGAGQAAQIISYTGATRTATVMFNNGATQWTTTPAADSGYVVAPYGVIPAAGSGTVGDPTTTGGLLQVMDAPAAPTGLAVAGAGLDRVTLKWADNAKSEIHYVIERATDQNFTQNDKIVGTTGFDATSFTDTGLTAGTKYYYRVRATNYDFQSGFSNVVSATTLAAAASGGSLAGLESAPAADTNLTTVGTQDWTHYGWFGPSVERMAGTPVIGNLITTGTPVGYGGNPNTYSWTNGFPVTAVNATGSGDFITGVGNGFELTAPADTTTRTLRVYVGEFNSTGKFTAHLSDGSAPDFVDQSLVNTGGTLTGVYTITYHASAPGEQLVVDWKMASDNGGGNITLQAAALSGTELIAPAGFSARTCAPGEVELNWTPNSVGETGFGIEQSADGVNFTQIAVAPAGSHTYTLTGLPQNTTYTYRIRALGTTNSGYSNTSSTNATGPLGVSHPSGFTGQNDLQLNGNAAVTATGVLELTNGSGNQNSSAFTKVVQRVDNFDTTFDFQIPATSSDADGFTFAIQNLNPKALGGGGGSMGYGGMGRASVAVKFDLYPNASTTGLYVNGNTPDDTAPASLDMSAAGINLHSGDKFQVHLTYDGTTLHEVVTDTTTNASFSHDYTVDIPSIVGDHCAYVGFTGASGGSPSQIDVGDWTYTANTTSTGPTTSQTIVGTGGNDTITVRKDADGTHDDVWVNVPATGAPTQQAMAGQPIVINGGGGTDTLVFDSTNGNPMPTLLTLNAGTGSFALNGALPALDASHVVDLGKSTLALPYTGASPISTIQSALKSGYIKSTDAAASAGKFAVADVDNGSQVTLSYRVVGDLNGDGTVGFSDLLSLAQHYNRTGVDWSAGDLNYDGTVGFADLLALAQHYGQTAGSTAAAAAPNLAMLSSVANSVQTTSSTSSTTTRKKASKVSVATKRR